MHLKFGKSLLRFRKNKQLTQQEAANYLNVSRQTYSAWENDYNEMPISKLFELEKIYDVDASYIILIIKLDNDYLIDSQNLYLMNSK